MILTSEQIKKAKKIKREVVPVPEWVDDGEVIVRGLGGDVRDEYEQTVFLERDEEGIATNVRARLAVLAIVDEDDNLLFTEDDIKWLGKTSAAALDRIYDVCQRLSGMGAQEVEEMEKNSEPAQNGVLSSA